MANTIIISLTVNPVSFMRLRRLCIGECFLRFGRVGPAKAPKKQAWGGFTSVIADSTEDRKRKVCADRPEHVENRVEAR